MKRKLFIVSIVAILLVAAVALSGCGTPQQDQPQGTAPDTDTGQPPADTPDDGAQEVDPGKEFVVGIPILTPSFDFFNTSNGFETFSMAQVYDTLVVKDNAGNYIGSLAESYTISADALTFTFYLHQNAVWSDGTKVTANDVKFSMEQLMVSPYTSWIYEPLLAEINVLDESTVEIVLQKSSVALLEYLANPYYCSILSEEAYDRYGEAYGSTAETIVSSGPYRVTSWSVGEYITYEANADYFLGSPPISQVRLVNMSDPATAMFALQTGEIDAYFSDIPGVSFDAISNAPDIGVEEFTSTILYTSFMNTQNGMFTDLRMRQAVAFAMSKEDYIIVGAEGFGVPADYPGDRGPGATTGDPEINGIWDNYYALDLDKARALVEESGNAGKAVLIKTYSTDPYPAMATVLQNALNQIGLDATIEQMERSTFIATVLGEGDFEIQVCRWAAGTEDMDEIIYGSLHTDSIGPAGNWSFYGNPEMDVLIEKAAAELDNNVRKGTYDQIIRMYLDDAVYIPLFYPTSSRAHSDRVTLDEGYAKFDKFIYYNWS